MASTSTHRSTGRPTLEDVAARAGVSRATVSRVVNRHSTVDPALAAAVNRAIDDLGYAPNRAARALMTNRTDAIALVAAEPGERVFGDPFFGGIVRGVSQELAGHGQQLILCMISDEAERDRVERYLLGRHTDGVLLFILMSKIGWTGRIEAVIVPGLVTAFGVFWMTQYLETALPFELVEAARVDGCSMIRTFWHVALPASRPAAAMLGLFTFIGSWTSFFWPFIVLGSSNPSLPVAIQLLQSSYFKDYSLILAGVTIAALPLIVVFAFTGKHLVAGVMAGAVKG